MKHISLSLLILLVCHTTPSFAQDESSFEHSTRLPYEDISNGKKWSPWSLGFFSIASITAEQSFNNSGGQISTYNYVGLNYALGNGKKFSIRPAFYFNTAGYNKYGDLEESSIKMGDVYFNYQDRMAALLPGNIGLNTQYRLYVPTGEYTKGTKQIAKAGTWLIFDKPLGKSYGLEYHVRPYYFFQSQTGYVLQTPTKSLTLQNKQWELSHWVALWKSFTQDFSVAAIVGRDFEHYYGITDEDPVAVKYNLTNPKTNLTDTYAVACSLRVVPGVSFKLQAQQNHPTFGSRTAFRLFDEGETEYTLWTFINTSGL